MWRVRQSLSHPLFYLAIFYSHSNAHFPLHTKCSCICCQCKCRLNALAKFTELDSTDREFLSFIGQVRQMISEEEQNDEDHPKTTHLVIPAAYSSGVTFFALRDSDVAQELLSSPDLPLL